MTAPLHIRRLTRLPVALAALAAEAEAEGYGFVERLLRDWHSGANRFDAPGECLLAAWRGGTLLGIGGLNRDPYDPDPATGRLRHVYVRPMARQGGVAAALVARLLALAPGHFTTVRLRVSDTRAARVYQALGFAPCDAPHATHLIALPRSQATAASSR